MPIDPGAVGAEAGPVERSWTSDDCLLYAVGVGAGVDDLAFTTENTDGVEQRVLPTFPVLLGAGGAFARIGTFDPAMLVHGEQGVRLAGPLPVAGTAMVRTRVTAIWDKGSGAVVETETVGVDAGTGDPLFTTTSAAFIRGEGGWGGDRGPSGPREGPPDRAPDAEVVYATRPDQALVYRLSGDRNPLHSDPSFAARAGFPRPILHGLCTYGFTGRALLAAMCDGDPARFGSMNGRFSSPVFPGEELTVRIWADGDRAVFRTTATDGRVVIDHGTFRAAGSGAGGAGAAG
jgi:acyl dehydratase